MLAQEFSRQNCAVVLHTLCMNEQECQHADMMREESLKLKSKDVKFKVVLGDYHRIFFGVKVKTVRDRTKSSTILRNGKS